jgi:short-subunit dehydrogenase
MTGFTGRYGPWAVVAGASEGLGAAFAHALAARGVHVVLVARRGEVLAPLAAELSARHHTEALPIVADLADAGAAAAVAAALGTREVGLLVYNAAASFQGPLLSRAPADTLRVIDVNVRGPALFAHAFLPAMAARGRGGFVAMSSLVGATGAPGLASYAASKAFTTALGAALWSELRPRGVDVVVSCAGAIRTPNYLRIARKDAPGTLAPEAVAEATLDALGRGPLVVPGLVNRLALFVMGRLLPRRAALAILERETGDALVEAP